MSWQGFATKRITKRMISIKRPKTHMSLKKKEEKWIQVYKEECSWEHSAEAYIKKNSLENVLSKLTNKIRMIFHCHHITVVYSSRKSTFHNSWNTKNVWRRFCNSQRPLSLAILRTKLKGQRHMGCSLLGYHSWLCLWSLKALGFYKYKHISHIICKSLQTELHTFSKPKTIISHLNIIQKYSKLFNYNKQSKISFISYT